MIICDSCGDVIQSSQLKLGIRSLNQMQVQTQKVTRDLKLDSTMVV